MNVELLRRFGQRLLALDGGQSHLRLESRAVIPARSSRHRLSCSRAILAAVRQKLHLSTCPNLPSQLSSPPDQEEPALRVPGDIRAARQTPSTNSRGKGNGRRRLWLAAKEPYTHHQAGATKADEVLAQLERRDGEPAELSSAATRRRRCKAWHAVQSSTACSTQAWWCIPSLMLPCLKVRAAAAPAALRAGLGGHKSAMPTFTHLDASDAAAFERDGYLIKRGLFSADEVALCNRVIATDPAIQGSRLKLADSAGGSTELALWNHPGDDVFGMIARCGRVAGGAEKLLGGEVYHYHSKLTMKRPGGGGRWEWHQDYGYWYQNGCLWPDMLSVAVALDAATRENGCMHLLRGSHKMGRIEHGRSGGQTGADPERVEQAMKTMEVVDCEMAPGDALFFHSNTLHCSAANLSAKPRNLLICCYNKATNNPYKAHHHPQFTKLTRLADEAVLQAGV